MTALLVAASVLAALGAAAAIGARSPSAATLGILVALSFAPFVADPLPDLPVLAFRIVAGVLAAFLLRAAGRSAGSPDPGLGMASAVVAGAAAFAAGLGATAVGLPAFGPDAAVAAGLASVAVAVAPIARSRDPFRLATCLLALVNGALLLRAGLGGTPAALEALLGGATLVAVAAAGVVLVATSATAAGPAADAAVTTRSRVAGLDTGR